MITSPVTLPDPIDHAAEAGAKAFYEELKPWFPASASGDWCQLGDRIKNAWRAAARAVKAAGESR